MSGHIVRRLVIIVYSVACCTQPYDLYCPARNVTAGGGGGWGGGAGRERGEGGKERESGRERV